MRSAWMRLGGSGIKKKKRGGGGVATTHRGILRCLTQLGFEALSVATTQSIAWKTGPYHGQRGMKRGAAEKMRVPRRAWSKKSKESLI